MHNFGVEFHLLGGLFCAMGAILLLPARERFREKRNLSAVPSSEPSSMRTGPVEVNGIAYSLHTLEAPFSGERCVFFEYSVDDISSGGNDQKIARGSSAYHSFQLRNETARFIVEPLGAELRLPVTFECDSLMELDEGLHEKVRDFLKTRDHAGLLEKGKQLRFRESIIRPGDPIFVVGVARAVSFVEEERAVELVSDNTHAMLARWDSEQVVSNHWAIHGMDGEYFFISRSPKKVLETRLGRTGWWLVFTSFLLFTFGIGMQFFRMKIKF